EEVNGDLIRGCSLSDSTATPANNSRPFGVWPILWVVIGACVGGAAGASEGPATFKELISETAHEAIGWGIFAAILGAILGAVIPVKKGFKGRMQGAAFGVLLYGTIAAIAFLAVSLVIDFIKWEASGVGAFRGAVIGVLTIGAVLSIS